MQANAAATTTKEPYFAKIEAKFITYLARYLRQVELNLLLAIIDWCGGKNGDRWRTTPILVSVLARRLARDPAQVRRALRELDAQGVLSIRGNPAREGSYFVELAPRDNWPALGERLRQRSSRRRRKQGNDGPGPLVLVPPPLPALARRGMMRAALPRPVHPPAAPCVRPVAVAVAPVAWPEPVFVPERGTISTGEKVPPIAPDEPREETQDRTCRPITPLTPERPPEPEQAPPPTLHDETNEIDISDSAAAIVASPDTAAAAIEGEETATPGPGLTDARQVDLLWRAVASDVPDLKRSQGVRLLAALLGWASTWEEARDYAVDCLPVAKRQPGLRYPLANICKLPNFEAWRGGGVAGFARALRAGAPGGASGGAHAPTTGQGGPPAPAPLTRAELLRDAIPTDPHASAPVIPAEFRRVSRASEILAIIGRGAPAELPRDAFPGIAQEGDTRTRDGFVYRLRLGRWRQEGRANL